MKPAMMLCALVLLSAPGLAAELDALFARLIGSWRSDADALDSPSYSVMTWSPVLSGEFVRLDYQIKLIAGSEPASIFEGIAYYKMNPGDTIDGFRADSYGYLHPISAERNVDALLAYWGVRRWQTRSQPLPAT